MTTQDRPKILIVDDVQANLVAMRRLLASVGADLYEAASGNEALALCLDHTFALVLLDVQMPDMDGFEVASHLSHDPATCDIPVVFVTATYLDDINRLKGYTFGAVDYIAKPINDAVLLSKVTVFLDLYMSKQRLKLALEELEQRNRQLVEEIAERRRVEKQIRHMATHDALTGLANRILFLEHLDRTLTRGHHQDEEFAVLYLDIDGFKAVNDSYGHAMGDELLGAISRRLRATVREEDVVARLSGDEFGIIVVAPTNDAGALKMAERICEIIAEPFTLAGHPGKPVVQVGVSVGVAVFPHHATSGSELMRIADGAMYRVKHNGKGAVLLAGRDAPAREGPEPAGE